MKPTEELLCAQNLSLISVSVLGIVLTVFQVDVLATKTDYQPSDFELICENENEMLCESYKVL